MRPEDSRQGLVYTTALEGAGEATVWEHAAAVMI